MDDIETGNTVEVRSRAFHSMASALKAVGALELAQKTREFEQRIEDGLSTETHELLQSFAIELDRLKSELRAFLEKQP